MNSFIFLFGMSGSEIRRFRVSISWSTIRSSSAFDRASPIDFTSSKNSFDWPNPPWDPIANSRPMVFNCSIFYSFWFLGIGFSRVLRLGFVLAFDFCRSERERERCEVKVKIGGNQIRCVGTWGSGEEEVSLIWLHMGRDRVESVGFGICIHRCLTNGFSSLSFSKYLRVFFSNIRHICTQIIVKN